MAHVVADPEMMTAAASDLAAIGSNVSAAHMVATARTTSVIPAAADEVSAGIAQLFSQHAANYQALAAQASAFEGQFEQLLTNSAVLYAVTETLAASYLQSTLTFEEGLVRGVVAMPSLLLDPHTYFEAIAPILTAFFLPVWLPPLVIASLIFLWLAEMGDFESLSRL